MCVQDMHLLAEREILSKLKAGGLLKGSVDEMVDYRIGALFMPHGTFIRVYIETFSACRCSLFPEHTCPSTIPVKASSDNHCKK